MVGFYCTNHTGTHAGAVPQIVKYGTYRTRISVNTRRLHLQSVPLLVHLHLACRLGYISSFARKSIVAFGLDYRHKLLARHAITSGAALPQSKVVLEDEQDANSKGADTDYYAIGGGCGEDRREGGGGERDGARRRWRNRKWRVG